MNILSNTFARCHDSGCPQSDTCKRYQQRSVTTGDPSKLNHMASMFPYDIPLGSECLSYIPMEEEL
jgi:hypothetical protein